VGVARIGAGTDLHRLETELFDIVEGLLERLVAKENGENANLHESTSLMPVRRT
jgi:hypothetical protein